LPRAFNNNHRNSFTSLRFRYYHHTRHNHHGIYNFNDERASHIYDAAGYNTCDSVPNNYYHDYHHTDYAHDI